MNGHKDDEGTAACLLQGKVGRTGDVQTGEEKASGDLIIVCKDLTEDSKTIEPSSF